MAVTHKVTVIAASGASALKAAYEFSGDSEQTLSLAIADSTTDGQVDLAFDKDRLKYFYLMSDQAITFETNNSSAPDDTFSILADTPFYWNNLYSSDIALPFSADVTVCYITNSSGSTANIDIRVLSDSTP